MASGTSSSWADCGDTRSPDRPPPPSFSSPDNSLSSGLGLSSSGSLSAEDAGSKHAPQIDSLAASVAGSSSAGSSLLYLINVGDVSGSVEEEESASCSDEEEQDSSDWTATDKCRYYELRDDGCTEPRTCQDCLNLELDEDYSCMVNQYGRCVQKTHANYVKDLDFRYQTASNECAAGDKQKVQFPSEAAAYCHHYDKECKICRETVFEDVMEGRLNGSLTKFCYGADGCVCVAVCEAPMWYSTVGQTVCNGTTVNKDYEKEHANTYGGSTYSNNGGGKGQGLGSLLMGIVGGVAAVVVLMVAVDWARKRRRTASDNNSSGSSNSRSAQEGGGHEGGEDAADGSVPVTVPAAPHLSLFGWQAMRSELIEREQLLLAGVEDFSNVRTGYLQLLDVDASAPPPEEEESSAPMLLVPLAGASAPTFSPRDVHAFASAPSAPPASPTFGEELL